MGNYKEPDDIPVRVLVAKDIKDVPLNIKGGYKILDFVTGRILKEDITSQKFTVSIKDITSEGIKIVPDKNARIYINNRQFRGDIDILKGGDNKLIVVNHIDIEYYLYGVLYHEVSHRWPMEVLKAQAIAARTYALYQKLITKNKYFELTSDVYSQMYGGRTSETWRTRRAVDLTKGEILTYESKIFPSYYHATCGGMTSDARTIWNIDIPTLVSRRCDFCVISPHYNWFRELKMDYIEDRLQDAGYKIQLVSLEILERDPAGRILALVLKGKDASINLSGNKFRLLISPNIIRSANFDVTVRGNFVIFQGKGWGHGVGMCQWGAYNMAKERWKAEEILEYYYHGAKIVRVE